MNMQQSVIILLFIIMSGACSFAKAPEPAAQQPALVVGIVVDQMRYDYLSRYWHRFGEDGFKRLVKNGFVCEQAHFPYVPTYTAVGHSSIYTGSVPAYHGIVGNNWFDREMEDDLRDG